MKLGVAVVCAVLLSMGAAASEEQREVGEDGDDGEDKVGCVADAAGAAELSVLSGQNSSGLWQAKVRLLHAVGTAADGAEIQPVHLQLQRSAQTFPDGTRTVSLEATLSGPGDLASSARQNSLPHARCTRGVGGSTGSTRRKPRSCPPECSPLPPLPTLSPRPPFAPSTAPPTSSPTAPPTSSPTATHSACPICPSCPPHQRHIPPGYEFYPGLGYYKIHLTPINWFDAKATCEREGAHLVVINSKEEAEMVANFHIQYNIPYDLFGIRIGLHDLLVEGTYYSVLGHSLAETGFAEWHPNEPNSFGGNEDCGSLYWTAQLNDISCLWNGTFVCEFPTHSLH